MAEADGWLVIIIVILFSILLVGAGFTFWAAFEWLMGERKVFK